jgi:NADH dehydrogenase [ubiquinone] 1 alpha subcomplex assembly factor 7
VARAARAAGAGDGVSAAAAPLLALLRQRIRADGPIAVAEYMADALGHPAHGYYMTRDPLGAAGDFVTSPEISQVFGELIGLWCVDLWQRLGAPDPFILAELGPGRGTLMADALRAAAAVPGFRRAARLHLVEVSPVLRARQALALDGAQPTWHQDARDLPPGPLLLVANEFLDALPIRQLERADDGWRERRIGLAADGETLVFVRDAVPVDEGDILIRDRHAGGGGLPAAALDPHRRGDDIKRCEDDVATRTTDIGAVREICPAALDLAGSLGRRLASDGGAALFIDYGYFPSACGDTLQALRRHRFAELLSAPGTADLTAHVDFAAVAEAAREGGARVFGPVPQGLFLRSLGIELRTGQLLRRATATQAEALVTGCNRLIDPDGMGSLFKALALTHPDLPAPAGFPPAPEGP